jgi:hypothetical protein
MRADALDPLVVRLEGCVIAIRGWPWLVLSEELHTRPPQLLHPARICLEPTAHWRHSAELAMPGPVLPGKVSASS